MLKILNNLKIAARPLMITQSRCMAVKHELYDHIQWKHPGTIASTEPIKSGDLSPLKLPKSEDYIYKIPEEQLKNLSELAKKVLSMEMNPRRIAVQQGIDELINRVKRHDQDYGSLEAKLAKMTGKIRAGQDALEQNPQNKKMKAELKELIDRRKKFLRHLRRYDYRRFEWVLEKLDLKYVPIPLHIHPIYRKEAMRAITRRYCNNIKQQRLDTLKEELASQQLQFLADKIKNLEFIRNEQIECKIPVTVSKEKIDAVKKQYAELKEKRDEEAEIKRRNEVRDDYEIKL